MLTDDLNAGIGVTFFSDYPNSDTYYRLRKQGIGSFHIAPQGTNITAGVSDTGVVPLINTWYAFRISVDNDNTNTIIKAKVWIDGTNEPTDWQVECYDDSPTRRIFGTVGVWSTSFGKKIWDDLFVL